uniref:potassium channel subfamily K member 12-like n=1 Tax=Myxine glutinosa TaxID=7769 RepID=UPI00358FE8B1
MKLHHAGETPPKAPRSRNSLPLSRESARFVLLAAFVSLYLLAGAAVFSALEAPEAAESRRRWREQLELFRREHNISHEDLQRFLRHLLRAHAAGEAADGWRPRWDFPGAFYFVSTVVSTIGFGMSTPATAAGKVFLIFYGLFGCSATILCFNLFLERVVFLLACCVHPARCDALSRLTRPDIADDGVTCWPPRHGSVGSASLSVGDPPIFCVALMLSFAALLVSCCASAIYSYAEGWTFLDSFYFCFVSFSTIGFGDLVPSQRAGYQNQSLYRLANFLCIFLGVCCLYSLFNAISILMRDSLNWLLAFLENCIDKRNSWTSDDTLHSDCRFVDMPRHCDEPCEGDVGDPFGLPRPLTHHAFARTPVQLLQISITEVQHQETTAFRVRSFSFAGSPFQTKI